MRCCASHGHFHTRPAPSERKKSRIGVQNSGRMALETPESRMDSGHKSRMDSRIQNESHSIWTFVDSDLTSDPGRIKTDNPWMAMDQDPQEDGPGWTIRRYGQDNELLPTIQDSRGLFWTNIRNTSSTRFDICIYLSYLSILSYPLWILFTSLASRRLFRFVVRNWI